MGLTRGNATENQAMNTEQVIEATEVKYADASPCPFCGCPDIDPKAWAREDGVFGPGCDHCGATTETIEGWNLRAESSNALLAEKVEVLQKCAEHYAHKKMWNGPEYGSQFAYIGGAEHGYTIAQQSLADAARIEKGEVK